MKDKSSGQHEGLLAGQARIEAALKNPKPLVKIEVRCSCCKDTQQEILRIVKEILWHQGGLSEAEEAKQAARLSEVVGPLKEAVEARQP